MLLYKNSKKKLSLELYYLTCLANSTPSLRPSMRIMFELLSDSEILIITPVSFLTRFTNNNKYTQQYENLIR